MSPTETAQAFHVCVLDDFAETVAARFVNCCVGLLHQRERIHVALTGGETARQVYQALARPELREHLDFGAIEFYEGDERPVPPDHPESNWGMAESLFLDAAGVPQANRHRMRAEAEDLDAAAREYEQLLRSKLPRELGVPAFDLLLLGMGADGHTASLFPGTAALNETHRLVVANDVPQNQTTRLTITFPLINCARAVWIMVSGSSKAEMVYRALERRDPALPIVRVVPTCGPIAWLMDSQAGSKLSPHVINTRE
jgi:6-phosphogluconolactonase